MPRRKIFGSRVGVSDFIFQSVVGTKRRVRICLGRPYEVSSREWACPVEIRGFEGRYPDIVGGDSMHALSLAIALVRSRMEDFVAKGGKVLDVNDGSEWDQRALEAHFG